MEVTTQETAAQETTVDHRGLYFKSEPDICAPCQQVQVLSNPTYIV